MRWPIAIRAGHRGARPPIAVAWSFATIPARSATQAVRRAVYARYKYWKDRGTPVSLIWDEKQAGETVPERFEFLLEGNDPSEMDLSIRCRGSLYVVTLINLRNGPRDLRLRVRLEGQVMDRYHARRVDEDAPVAMERSVEALYCKMSIPPLGSARLAAGSEQGLKMRLL